MKKRSPKSLKNELWELCKKVVRSRYKNEDESWNCFTCGRRIDEARKAQTGHFIPSGGCGAYLRYDLRNLRIQCYNCNINLGGNGAEFYRRMILEVGKKETNQIFKDKQKIIKADELFYLQLINKYKLMTSFK